MSDKVMVCRPFITLRNGKVLWAHQVGLEAFCFMGDKDYKPKKKTTTHKVVASNQAKS